jgi:hypothetical protein
MTNKTHYKQSSNSMKTTSEQKDVAQKILTANEYNVVSELGHIFNLKYYLKTDVDKRGSGKLSDSKYRISDWATPPFFNKNGFRQVEPKPYDDPDVHFGNIG